MSTQSPLASANSFFAHPLEAAPEVVTGILGERQIGYLAGDWSLGKTPLLQELSLSVAAGIPFLGRETTRRHVLVFDAETPYEDYRPSLERIAARLRVESRDVAQLEPILRYGHQDDAASAGFREVVGSPQKAIAFIREKLADHPDALVVIDPLMEVIPYNEKEPLSAIVVYRELRAILGDYRRASFLFTLHLRKGSQQNSWLTTNPTSYGVLLNNPREWFKEVAGTNKIGAHADVRLGMAATSADEHQFVIHGFRRGKPLAPLCFEKSLNQEQEYDGFVVSQLPAGAIVALEPEQIEKLRKLPSRFRFGEVADSQMPRATLHRLLVAAQKAGRAFKENDGRWRLEVPSA